MKNGWYFVIPIACLLTASCTKKEAAETEAPPPVQVTGVTQEPIRRIVAGDGVLFPLDQSTVTPNISKPVVKFHVNRGDHVKAGQLLATLESTDLRAAVANARAQVAQATAGLHTTEQVTVPESLVKAQTDVEAATQAVDAAKKLLDSRQSLLTQGALAARQVEEARVQYYAAKAQLDADTSHLRLLNSAGKQDQVATSRAQLDAANAVLSQAEAQLSYAEIHSPRAGVVSDRPLYEGETAAAGTPLLTIMDISRIVARVNIPQSQGTGVKIGQSAEVATGIEGEEPLQGKVTVVSPATDVNSTTLQVWVQLDNPGEKLKPGASVRVRIITEDVRNATTIPTTAILPGEEGGTAVLVIDAQSIAHRHAVVLGIREGNKVQVLNGARPGDEVVVVGGLGIDDKAKVRIVDTTVQEADDENAPDAGAGKDDKGGKDAKKDEAKPKAK